jgi:iron complex transport system ATP-binding protein
LTCLIGPNGSGKTSLLHALAGIGRAEGEILIGGHDPRLSPPAERSALLIYVPASRHIAWSLRAGDLVELGITGEDVSERVRASLELLGLDGFENRRVDRMSTGERSRVLLARALAAAPRLLLLDEPTANLDPYWQLRLMDHLCSLAHEQGRTMLIALHDLEVARRYGDRLLLMEEGEIVADGRSADILDGAHLASVFGIRKIEGEWVWIRPEDRRSSP